MRRTEAAAAAAGAGDRLDFTRARATKLITPCHISLLRYAIILQLPRTLVPDPLRVSFSCAATHCVQPRYSGIVVYRVYSFPIILYELQPVAMGCVRRHESFDGEDSEEGRERGIFGMMINN
ncbi:unnamed protein product, partial [Trichogramma brassicae]